MGSGAFEGFWNEIDRTARREEDALAEQRMDSTPPVAIVAVGLLVVGVRMRHERLRVAKHLPDRLHLKSTKPEMTRAI